MIERIADGLRIPGHLLGLAPRPWEPPEDAPPPPSMLETWEVIDTLTRSTINDSALMHLQAAVVHDATRYPSTSPDELMPGMRRHLAKTHQLLAEPQALSARRRSVELLSVLSGLLGLAHLDVGDLHRSAAFIHVGQIAAREAEDKALTAWLLTMQGIILTATDRAATAVERLEHAETLGVDGPHRRRAWIAAQLARAHAGAGNAHDALAALDRSAHHLDRADMIGGLDFFTPARLDGVHGTARLLIGDHETASSLLERALATRERADVKGRAMLTFDLAECHIRRGEIEEGCRVAHAALDLVSREAVHPGLQRARTLRRTLRPWSGNGAVIAVTERMRESRMYVRD